MCVCGSSIFCVNVKLINDNTGHHIPTDSPLRHLILLIEATDANGDPLPQVSGPLLADYAGIGDPSEGYFGGLPGVVYAKILQDLWTEISPSGSYWNPTRVVSDNRIAALETASSEYSFAALDQGQVTISVRLLYRRAFIEIMDWKGWDVPDLLMAEEIINLD